MEYQINFTGGMIAAQVFGSREELDTEKKAITDYRAKWDEIRAALGAAGLTFSAGFGAFCPYQQFIRVSALRPEDEPAIRENGVYVDFRVNMKEGKIEVHSTGHIWLTREDQRKSYLCMCGIRQVVESAGGKWFRKQAYKTPEDLAGRVSRFWSEVVAALDKMTEGYPYKQMAVNIY